MSGARRWSGFFLLMVSVCISLVLIEIAFRILFEGEGTGYKSDSPLSYFYPERSSGNRDFRYSRVKPAETFRIVVVGDSFAFGYGGWFDDAFPKRLERILNYNETGRHVEVLNFSIPSYSTKDEVRIVKKAVEEFQADLVLLQITLNDAEIIPFEFNTPEFRRSVLPEMVKGGVYNYWKSLRFVVNRIQRAKSRQGYVRYFRGLFSNPDTLASFEASIKSIEAGFKEQNARVAAVIFPLFSFPFDAAYPFADVHNTITSILRLAGIPSLDLLNQYQGMNIERLQAVPGKDPHPNAIAHRVAAEAIYKWLMKTGLVPEEFKVRKKAQKRKGPRTMEDRLRWEEDL